MAVDQSFLDGLRTQAGLGTGSYTRTASARSADQNQTQSGNPMTSYNQAPPSWAQLARSQRQPMQPNTGRFVAPMRLTPEQQAARLQSYQGSPAQQQAMLAAQNPQQQGPYAQALTAMPQVNGFNAPTANGIGQMMGQPGMQMNTGIGGQPSRFIQPQAALGGGPIPDQLAQRSVVGSRFVRPMVR